MDFSAIFSRETSRTDDATLAPVIIASSSYPLWIFTKVACLLCSFIITDDFSERMSSVREDHESRSFTDSSVATIQVPTIRGGTSVSPRTDFPTTSTWSEFAVYADFRIEPLDFGVSMTFYSIPSSLTPVLAIFPYESFGIQVSRSTQAAV